jgi:hypothetical protein
MAGPILPDAALVIPLLARMPQPLQARSHALSSNWQMEKVGRADAMGRASPAQALPVAVMRDVVVAEGDIASLAPQVHSSRIPRIGGEAGICGARCALYGPKGKPRWLVSNVTADTEKSRQRLECLPGTIAGQRSLRPFSQSRPVRAPTRCYIASDQQSVVMGAGCALGRHQICRVRRLDSRLDETGLKLCLAIGAAQIGIWDWELESGLMNSSPKARAICAPDGNPPEECQILLHRIFRHGADRLASPRFALRP